MTDARPERFGRPKGVVAVLDTSVLVRAWLSAAAPPNPSRRDMLLAGLAYDSFTSPAILNEVESVASPDVWRIPARCTRGTRWRHLRPGALRGGSGAREADGEAAALAGGAGGLDGAAHCFCHLLR